MSTPFALAGYHLASRLSSGGISATGEHHSSLPLSRPGCSIPFLCRYWLSPLSQRFQELKALVPQVIVSDQIGTKRVKLLIVYGASVSWTLDC
ncbi:hypothetical protein BDZ97DRAFT_397539 [Flammula alnicola]|nr:hypothetical protein BDZ97DRAFT_397539 [Flammula alnicola]